MQDEKERERQRRYHEKNREKRNAYAREWHRTHPSKLQRAIAEGPEAVEKLRASVRDAGKRWREKSRKGKPPSLRGALAPKMIFPVKHEGVSDSARRQHPDLGWLIEHVGAVAVRRLRHQRAARRDFAVWSAARDSLPARPVAAEFSSWMNGLGQGHHGGTPLAPGSLRNLYWSLAALYDTAKLLGKATRNPIREAPEPTGDTHAAAFSWRVVQAGFPRVLAATIDWRERAFYTVLRFTGLRVSECLGLRPEHVLIFPGGRVQLQVVTQRNDNSVMGPDLPLKHDRQRRILPLSNPDLITQLLRARRECPTVVRTRDKNNRPYLAKSPYLFPFSATRMNGLISRLHAVLPDLPFGIGWHGFRHAYAAEARLVARATIDEISQWLGHSSPEVTRVYFRSLLGEVPNLDDYSARVTAAQMHRPVEAPAPVNVFELPERRR